MNEKEEMMEQREKLVYIEKTLLSSITVDITLRQETSTKATQELFRICSVIVAIDEYLGKE